MKSIHLKEHNRNIVNNKLVQKNMYIIGRKL